MKKRLTNTLSLMALQCLLFLPLQAQISSSIVGPANSSSMADEIAFLYQAQLNISFNQLSQFIQNHPVPIFSAGGCATPEPTILSQDDNQISFRWPSVSGKKQIHWVRYLNLENGAMGIESTNSNTIQLKLENSLYLFMFQRSCNGIGSNEYIIIDDKPISMPGDNNDEICNCDILLPIADVDNFEGQVLSDWPTTDNFAETYYVRVKTYFGESDFTTPPDMYSSFSFNAYGGNGEVYLLEYRNACDSNADHDYASIFSTDNANTDVDIEGGNESPAFLQFSFSGGINVDPLGSFYNGKIHIRKCINFDEANANDEAKRMAVTLQSARAFPNPSTGVVQLNYFLSTEEQIEIQLFNSLGQLLEVLSKSHKDAGAHRLMIDLSPFPIGAYYCRIQGATYTQGLWLSRQ